MFKNDNDKRFEMIYSQGAVNGVQIWLDTQTGVNYVFGFNGSAGGMTVLLDREGNPVVSPRTNY